jgi:hypothetical protein
MFINLCLILCIEELFASNNTFSMFDASQVFHMKRMFKYQQANNKKKQKPLLNR